MKRGLKNNFQKKKNTNIKAYNFQYLCDRYRSIFIMLVYMCIYVSIFAWLEQRPVSRFHIINTHIDHLIPFNEYFVIPYFAWFIYVPLAVLYIGIRNQEEGDRFAQFLMIGMTVFLGISVLYPNVQYLRPHNFARDNIFVDMVKGLYATDTSTNILPSIHVYNSIAVMIACGRDVWISKHKIIKYAIYCIGISIVLATMFIKQHSIIDVTSALALCVFAYQLCYKLELQYRRKGETSSIHYKF